MFKKNLLFFIILVLCFYFVFCGVFGKNGYLYNQSLKKQLNTLIDEAQELGIDINLLLEEKSLLTTEEGLRDAAINLGYYINGDTIHVFEDVSLQESGKNSQSSQGIELFNPWSGLLCFSISAVVSSAILFVWLMINRKKANKNDITENRPSDNTDGYFINA